MILSILGSILAILSIEVKNVDSVNIYKTESENNLSMTIDNLKKGLSKDYEEIKKTLSSYPIDFNILKKAESVSFSIDKIPDYDGSASQYGKDVFKDEEGYITLSTIVYDFGYISSKEKLYYTQAFVDYNKTFYLRNTDSLIIHSGDGSVQYFDKENTYSFTYNRLFGNGTVYTQNIIKDYSSNYGIRYDVKLPEDTGIVAVPYANQVYNWKFNGDYYFIAKSTTFVQTCYVHNESIIGDKLSITIDKLGISITGGKTSYYGKGINVYVKD